VPDPTSPAPATPEADNPEALAAVGGRDSRGPTKGQTRADGSLVKGRPSDAGGPRFESQTGWVTGRPTPSLGRGKHPGMKGLRPPEHHAGQFNPDQQTFESQENGLV